MKVTIKSLIICSAISLTLIVNAQTINCNPDPNGEEWIAGGLPELTPEILNQLEAIPELELNSKSILTTLPSKVDNSQPSKDLPEQYWVDIVTEQPEGYVVDENGDVHIHSAEALAWLSAVSNGLNGQEADDFEGKIVTLEANVDMSSAIWTAIAEGELEDTSPDKLRFSGKFDGNGFVISGITLSLGYKRTQTSVSFFGALEGAHIEDVVLRHAHAEGYQSHDGKFFVSADLVEESRTTVIDRCFVEFDEILKYTSYRQNTALFGYYNNGIIRNCMAVLHKADVTSEDHEDNLSLFVWQNTGTIENCASIADSVHWGYHYYLTGIAEINHASGTIENCYSYIGDFWGEYGMPFEQVPRAGICWANYGQVKNCYYNMWPGSDEHLDECHSFYDSPVNTSYGGEITETASFMPTPYFQYPYWVLNDSVNIPSPSGFVYSTDELRLALFDWVLGRNETGQYLWWDANEAFLPYNLPSLYEIDINSMQEDTALKSCPAYPNPSGGMVSVVLPEGASGAQVEMFSLDGRLVMSEPWVTGGIDISRLATGIYIMRVATDNGVTFEEKVVRE